MTSKRRSVTAIGLVVILGLTLMAYEGASSRSATPTKTAKVVKLAPGYEAGAKPTPLRELTVGRVWNIDTHVLHRAPLRLTLIKDTVLSMVQEPGTRVRVQYLLISKSLLVPGAVVVVVAGSLATHLPRHDVMYVLTGPDGVRYQRLVVAENGIAAGRVSLPLHMKNGIWALGVEDNSQVKAVTGAKLTGEDILDLSIFRIGSSK